MGERATQQEVKGESISLPGFCDMTERRAPGGEGSLGGNLHKGGLTGATAKKLAAQNGRRTLHMALPRPSTSLGPGGRTAPPE